jgi:DNA topoisomerase-1
MNLVIVESPAKCKKIQEFLGKKFIVKSSFGHFRDLKKKSLGIDIENDFTPTYDIIPDKKKTITELKTAFKKCETLYLAADNDREGEAIAWHLNTVLNNGKNTSKRILFNEITKKALQNAVDNPGSINTNMFYAQQARRIIDRLVGFLISPCLWKNVQSSYKEGQGLSAGRVQSVVNKLIIEREDSINKFEKKSYYNLAGNLDFKNNSIPIKYSKPKTLDNEEKILDIFNTTKTEQFIVTDIKNKKKKESAKPPFTTSTLQQEAHNKLNMSSKQTMLVAQKLYEAGHITYMRTDSTIISNDAQEEIREEILKLYGEKYYKKNSFKTKTKNAQEAHECCRVTKIDLHRLSENSNNDEKRLYELIWKRTISSQMAQMIKDVLDVIINLDKYIFNSSYEKVDFDGYSIVYNNKKEAKNTALLELKVNSILDFVDFTAEQKFTTPEPRFNDSMLVKKLEELGIGRPSTYANMVNSVLDKNYAIIKDNIGTETEITNFYLKKNCDYTTKKDKIMYGSDKAKINPTQIGIIVNDYLTKYFDQLINYEFTAQMENDLDKVSNGECMWQSIVQLTYNKIKVSIEKSPKSVIKNDYARILGVNPNNNKTLSVYIGQYGPVLKEENNSPGCKHRFISLKDELLDDITLEQAVNMLSYPRVIGTYDNIDIILDKGRYGQYIKYNNKNYSYKISDENNIDIDSLIAFIDIKSETQTKYGEFKKVNAKIKIMKGPYGPYINYDNKTNYKIPIDKSFNDEEIDNYLKNLSVSDCNELISEQKSKPKKKYVKKDKK